MWRETWEPPWLEEEAGGRQTPREANGDGGQEGQSHRPCAAESRLLPESHTRLLSSDLASCCRAAAAAEAAEKESVRVHHGD